MQLEPEFTVHQEQADPIKLWMLIKEKHQSTGAKKGNENPGKENIKRD